MNATTSSKAKFQEDLATCLLDLNNRHIPPHMKASFSGRKRNRKG